MSENKPLLVSDNGTQLVSKGFKKFPKDLGIKHSREPIALSGNKHK